jgi:hypothetical protein
MLVLFCYLGGTEESHTGEEANDFSDLQIASTLVHQRRSVHRVHQRTTFPEREAVLKSELLFH